MRSTLFACLLMAASLGTTGCNIISALAYYTAPPQIKKAEFALAPSRLAVLVEAANPEEDNPIFVRAFHQRLAELLTEHRIAAQLVPLDEVLTLRQQHPDFATWNLQKVGRWLNAEQVLYVRLERLQIRETPGSPILAPAVQMRLKLIGTNQPPDQARLWPGPQERDGRVVLHTRPPKELGSLQQVDDEAAKLGKDAAYLAALPFHDVDLEQKPRWEP